MSPEHEQLENAGSGRSRAGSPERAGTASSARVSSGEPGTAGASRLDLLLETQELDLSLDRLSYRRRELAERRALAAAEASRAGLAASLGELQSRRGELGAAEDEREKQIAAITSRIEAIESRLRSGSSGSFRDQQAMGEEVASLEGQKRRAEDAEIEVMEQLEPVIAELAELVRDVARLDEEIAAARAALSAAEAGIDEESSRLRASRQGVAAGIDDALRRDYEALRAKLGGIGAARVVEGSCSGCHLKLPASERDRISHASPGSIAHCEQCGRILVP